VRRLLTLLSFALLLPSAWDAVAAASRNAALWSRLRTRGGVAPDTGWDREYRALLPYLPPSDPIGLVQRAPAGTPTHERQYYFLQYAVAPRLVMPGAAAEFVVVHAAPAAAGGLIDQAAFTLIERFGDDFALYRRTRR
jgi:hypothetical protein